MKGVQPITVNQLQTLISIHLHCLMKGSITGGVRCAPLWVGCQTPPVMHQIKGVQLITANQLQTLIYIHLHCLMKGGIRCPHDGSAAYHWKFLSGRLHPLLHDGGI